MVMKSILSIIIPCYNSEKTLKGTLDSILEMNFEDWEAIIVNDGSIDSTGTIALNFVKKDDRFKYYSKQNEGLGKTRNYGIEKATGKYILPLDSDNQLKENFAQEAIDVFENDDEIGVVYGDAEYFGEKTGRWEVDEYKLEKILVHNYIDACAIYKREIWEEVGGYDENMPYQGHEDWEFWIALGTLNVNFHHLNRTTFKYFVSKDSMIRSFTDIMDQLNNDYIFKKYSKLYQKHYKEHYLMYKKKEGVFFEKLKSEKFVIDLFCSTFFGFSIFGLYKIKKH
jgi:glycosyltransferase involved in cell wall biosynthesis